VDDFAISGSSPEECNKVRETIQKQMTNKLHDLGVIKRFNGLDIHQMRDYIRISCELYIDKIARHHGWENEKVADRPVPMRNDAAYQATLELAKAPETENCNENLKRQWVLVIAKRSENSFSLSPSVDLTLPSQSSNSLSAHLAQHRNITKQSKRCSFTSMRHAKTGSFTGVKSHATTFQLDPPEEP
jgi:hypothetical protein